MRTSLYIAAILSLFTGTAFGQVLSRNANENVSIVLPMKLERTDSSPTGYRAFTTSANAGTVDFDFSVTTAGNYQVEGQFLADSTTRNSVAISVNGQAAVAWDITVASGYQWARHSQVVSLPAGTIRVRVLGREAYTRIAALRLAASGATPTPTPTPTPEPTPTPTPIGTLDPAKAPGRNFNLSLWKITLPLDSSGGMTGTAVEVKPIPLDYQKSPYFYTAADGGMVFQAPVEGATTSGSKYSRSELREMTSSYTNAAWTIDQGGTLSATLAVNEVPTKSDGTKGRIMVGQIHGPNDELNRLYYDNGKIYFHDDKSGPNHQETQFYLKSSTGAFTNIPLNSIFDYTIKVANRIHSVTVVHNGVTYTASEPVSSFWSSGLYFKAGVYLGVGKAGSGAGTIGTGRGRATFYRLTPPTHP